MWLHSFLTYVLEVSGQFHAPSSSLQDRFSVFMGQEAGQFRKQQGLASYRESNDDSSTPRYSYYTH